MFINIIFMTSSGLIQSIESMHLDSQFDILCWQHIWNIFFNRKFVFENFMSQKQESLNITCAANGEVTHMPKSF